MKTLNSKIADVIRPSMEADGFALVQVNVMDGSRRRTIQVLAENEKTGRITLDECAQLSHAISALLDVEDVIEGAYNLEVSSPGVDRPLINQADFEKYQGFDAKIETALPVDGRRRFKGVLVAVDDLSVTIRVDNQDYRLVLDNIHAAKLILTDALIKAHQDGKFKSADAPSDVVVELKTP